MDRSTLCALKDCQIIEISNNLVGVGSIEILNNRNPVTKYSIRNGESTFLKQSCIDLMNFVKTKEKYKISN